MSAEEATPIQRAVEAHRPFEPYRRRTSTEFPLHLLLDGPYEGRWTRADEVIESVLWFPTEVVVSGKRGVARYALGEIEEGDTISKVAEFVRMG